MLRSAPPDPLASSRSSSYPTRCRRCPRVPPRPAVADSTACPSPHSRTPETAPPSLRTCRAGTCSPSPESSCFHSCRRSPGRGCGRTSRRGPPGYGNSSEETRARLALRAVRPTAQDLAGDPQPPIGGSPARSSRGRRRRAPPCIPGRSRARGPPAAARASARRTSSRAGRSSMPRRRTSSACSSTRRSRRALTCW